MIPLLPSPTTPTHTLKSKIIGKMYGENSLHAQGSWNLTPPLAFLCLSRA